MKKNMQIAIFIALFVVCASELANTVAAYPGPPPSPDYIYPLAITSATYMDLDGDGNEDDILVNFSLFSPTGYLCYMEADFSLNLFLPSGTYFTMNFSIDEVFVELPVTLELYNTATESGWYDLYLQADIWGFDAYGSMFYGTVSDDLTFDPRDFKDGGLPYGIILY